jgi:hypothetical protein
MSRKFVVIFMGAVGAGKSTITTAAAKYINAEVLSFATYLKQSALEAGWSGVKDEEGRRFLQTHADELKKVHGEDIFFRKGIEAAKASSASTLVFDDGRAFVELGGATLLADLDVTICIIDFYEKNAEDQWFQAAITNHPSCAWAKHRSETEWRSIRDRYPRFTNDKSRGILYNAIQLAAFIVHQGQDRIPGGHEFALS